MAEFTDQDKELLDKLRKANEREGKTRSQLDPWQELLSREATTNANRSLVAAKVIEGFAGSWAAQYNYGYGSTINPTGGLVSEPVAGVDPQGPPVPVRSIESKLGKRGVPEVNFVPYNWRTNTFGNKGPSLIGHPISFEIVGPTLKSPAMDWTWRVEIGTGTGGGDKLIMDVRSDGGANIMQPYAGDLTNAYGPDIRSDWVIGGGGGTSEPNGGIYLVISDNGVNDGSLPAGRLPLPSLDIYADSAHFEIFRVAAIPNAGVGSPYEIHLHPDKPLSQVFDISNAPNISIRAITVLKPYVTRLQAIPQSGAVGGHDGESVSGREQTFVVISPERAASGDNFPPYNGGAGGGGGTWLQGGFTESRAPGTTTAGEPSAYGGKNRLPIPKPVTEVSANVESALANSTLTGQWAIETGDITPYTTGVFSSRFPIINITVTQRDDTLPQMSLGSIPSCLGWFDVADVDNAGGSLVFLNRVPETDPKTGLTYWGPGPFVVSTAPPTEVNLLGTLHEPIESLWYGEFNLDNVDSARLKNLIDPQWVGHLDKHISDPLGTGAQFPPPSGGAAGRSDRAIFNTRSFAGGGVVDNAENPGNLRDLGFRMVLFPAKPDLDDPTQAVPDFDRPILGRELVIDGSIQEKQYVDIDYSAGIVRLSHPPPQSRSGVPLAPSDVIPNGIVGANGNNPRGEVILFAACVPYSMEDSQLGASVRVTSSDAYPLKDRDVYSDQVSAKIDLVETTFAGAAPFIGVSPLTLDVAIVLDRVWEGPETGVITIQDGSAEGAAFGRWGYTEKVQIDKAPGIPVTALKGITSLPGSSNPDPLLGANNPTRYVTLRREVVFHEESVAIPSLSDFAPADTYYGSASRADTLRFSKSRIVPKLDGSLEIRSLPDFGFQERATGTIVPSKMPFPIGDPSLGAPFSHYYAEEGVLMNLDYQVPVGDPRGTKPGGLYQFTPGGVSIPMSTVVNPGVSWHGFITMPGGDGFTYGHFQLAENFRFVAKISTQYREAVQLNKAFIGLVQDDGVLPNVAPTVDFITQGPTGGVEAGLPPRYSVIGLQMDNDVSNNWRFWTRGPNGVENVITTPALSQPSAFFNGPYYFVIEVAPFGATILAGSVVVKMGIFDKDKNLLQSINVTQSDLLPIPDGSGLFVCGGARRTAAAAPFVFDLHIHKVSVVFDKDRGTFDVPKLP